MVLPNALGGRKEVKKMPNWSFNEVRITGPEETLEKIAKQVRVSTMAVSHSYSNNKDSNTRSLTASIRTNEFSLEGVIPQPPIVRVQLMNDDDGINTDVVEAYCARHNINNQLSNWQDQMDCADYWYNWRNEHWGTKWDTRDACVDMMSNELFASFNTAWAPPEPVFEELSRQYPDVLIECVAEIEGWDNYRMKWKDGQKISEEKFLNFEDLFDQCE